MMKKNLYTLLIFLTFGSILTSPVDTPFYELFKVVTTYSDLEAEYSDRIKTMEPLDLGKITMRIHEKYFEAPSKTRLDLINQLTRAYADGFGNFMQQQKSMRMIQIDSQPLEDSEFYSNFRNFFENLKRQQKTMEMNNDNFESFSNPHIDFELDLNLNLSSESSSSIDEDNFDEQFKEFVKNVDQMKKNGYYINKAIKEGLKATPEEVVVQRLVLKEFQRLFEDESELDDVHVAGKGAKGIVFILDVDEDDLVNPKPIQNVKPVKSIHQDDSSESNVDLENAMQSTSKKETVLDNPLKSSHDLSDKVDTFNPGHSSDFDLDKFVTESLMIPFAAKKSIFYAVSPNTNQENYEVIYGLNRSFLRELEANMVVKTRDPLSLFYIKNYGSVDITEFIDNLNLKSYIPEVNDNLIQIDEENFLKGNVGFLIMNQNAFDLKTFMEKLNLKKTMMFYYTFLQMMLNLLNGLIIMHFEFEHCDLKPGNIMFRELENDLGPIFYKEIPWINTVKEEEYRLFSRNPKEVYEQFEGEKIIAYPMELFPGQYFLMSIVDSGNDEWIFDPCEPIPKNQFYRKCFTTTSAYSPIEFNKNSKQISNFDVFSLSMMFTEILMEEIGFGGFSIWNKMYMLMKDEFGLWSYYSGTIFNHLNTMRLRDLQPIPKKESDHFDKFKTKFIDPLRNDPMYIHLQEIWDGPDFTAKKELVRKLDKALIANGEFNNFFEVFSIKEDSDKKNDEILKKINFDMFLYANRSQFSHLWLMILRYFWDNIYLQKHSEQIDKMFKNDSDLMEKKKDDPSEKAKRPRASLTESSDEEIFASFLDEVHQMKKEVLPLKHHMGLVLFNVFNQKYGTLRFSLEHLRAVVEGQYYSIIAQAPKTFGVELQKNNAENSDSSQEEDLFSASDKPSKIPDELKFGFDLDFIIKVRNIKHVITIDNGEVVRQKEEFDSDSNMSMDSSDYDGDSEEVLGKKKKMKRPLSVSSGSQQFKNLRKKLKCMRDSKKKGKGSGEIDQHDSDQSEESVDLDESNKHAKII
jgi:hypothetical protein